MIFDQFGFIYKLGLLSSLKYFKFHLFYLFLNSSKV